MPSLNVTTVNSMHQCIIFHFIILSRTIIIYIVWWDAAVDSLQWVECQDLLLRPLLRLYFFNYIFIISYISFLLIIFSHVGRHQKSLRNFLSFRAGLSSGFCESLGHQIFLFLLLKKFCNHLKKQIIITEDANDTLDSIEYFILTVY